MDRLTPEQRHKNMQAVKSKDSVERCTSFGVSFRESAGRFRVLCDSEYVWKFFLSE